MKNLIYLAVIVVFAACSSKNDLTVISADDFKFSYLGNKIEIFNLENENGLVCQLTNFGARVVSLYTPDRNGKFADVVAGYGTGKDFVEKKENYFGATIGRYGNRIGNATFEIDGIDYKLEKNNGENHLHGGGNGFHRQIWNVESSSKTEITFSYVSADMECGYPGTINVKIKYQLTPENELKIEYFATSDKKTVLNLTNHTYFNLKDAGASTINNHVMQINADYYTPVDAGLIPTGRLNLVEDTPFDFRKATRIAQRVDDPHEQLRFGNGYDHNWVLNTSNNVTILAAKVIDPESGRVMEVFTNEPGVQFYGGNFLNGNDIGKNSIGIGHRNAFCLETQHFPDSPNKPDFPCVILDQGEQYYSVCIYKFSSS
ncbi:aldose 1-epimerase [Mariniphaga anaerophila]|uniref:Aldose 1-epimerase n=1 Tax=Mariniphaga anaerophila TaxID=1484053 RepID=A0A1M4U479_9BACT|nr:aldose epimerase family protein [Mariniphaga anaerophila]SHE51538.1 aldose 1-epimerase [Mariniphaga anaerophila]